MCNKNQPSAFSKKPGLLRMCPLPRAITVDKNPAYPVAIQELQESSRGKIKYFIFAPLTTPYVRIAYTAFQFILQCVLLDSVLKQKVFPSALVFCLRLLFEQLSIILCIGSLFDRRLILSLLPPEFLVE